MLRLIQILVIGSLCAVVFALLYGNSSPVAVSFFGSTVASGSLGGFLLVSFFTGLLLASLGAFFYGIRQSFHTRRVAAQNRKLRAAWDKFSEAQLSKILGDDARAEELYTDLLRSSPEATAVFVPLAESGSAEALAALPQDGSALVQFLRGKQAERESSYVRATELYSAAYEQTRLPALLRLARDASIRAELFDKARTLHQKLAQSANLNDADTVIEAQLAARDLPSNPEERPSKLRELVRRYPNSAVLVEELAALETTSGKPDQAALLLGRSARLNPTAERIAAFEAQLHRLSLERALSVIDQAGKGASCDLFLPTKLATMIQHRAISAATEAWEAIEDKSAERLQRLGAAIAILAERKDAAVDSLTAVTPDGSLLALTKYSEPSNKKVVGLAPQFSTP